jgi:hypothetical protein
MQGIVPDTTPLNYRSLTVIGTLSVLDAAAAYGWLDLPEMFDRLNQTSLTMSALSNYF